MRTTYNYQDALVVREADPGQISATSADAQKEFNRTTKFVVLNNTGSKTVYVAFDREATVNDFPIIAGQVTPPIPMQCDSVHVVTNGSDTSTVGVLGLF